jgi:hypothetical protein
MSGSQERRDDTAVQERNSRIGQSNAVLRSPLRCTRIDLTNQLMVAIATDIAAPATE